MIWPPIKSWKTKQGTNNMSYNTCLHAHVHTQNVIYFPYTCIKNDNTIINHKNR